jgi:hypothetical protein
MLGSDREHETPPPAKNDDDCKTLTSPSGESAKAALPSRRIVGESIPGQMRIVNVKKSSYDFVNLSTSIKSPLAEKIKTRSTPLCRKPCSAVAR